MSEFTCPNLSQPFAVGGIEIRNRVFLAPMSGVTDVPMRQLAWRFGAGMVVSEMVASEAFVEGEAEMQLKVESAGLPIHMVQLAGREADWMARAAKIAQNNGANIIDINMGCPAKRVTTGYSGSALMRDLDHAASLIDAVLAAVSVPVTLKMRLGWDEQSINAPELARRAEALGVSMITVHGRTRNQFYKGKADWRKIAAVRDQISVPLVVNGDIGDVKSADDAMAKSGADAIMIGRASYGNPWLPGLIANGSSLNDIQNYQQNVDLILEHHDAMLSFYGIESGVRQSRKHLGWYIDNLQLPNDATLKSIKRDIMTGLEPSSVQSNLVSLFDLAKSYEFKAA